MSDYAAYLTALHESAALPERYQRRRAEVTHAASAALTEALAEQQRVRDQVAQIDERLARLQLAAGAVAARAGVPAGASTDAPVGHVPPTSLGEIDSILAAVASDLAAAESGCAWLERARRAPPPPSTPAVPRLPDAGAESPSQPTPQRSTGASRGRWLVAAAVGVLVLVAVAALLSGR